MRRPSAADPPRPPARRPLRAPGDAGAPAQRRPPKRCHRNGVRNSVSNLLLPPRAARPPDAPVAAPVKDLRPALRSMRMLGKACARQFLPSLVAGRKRFQLTLIAQNLAQSPRYGSWLAQEAGDAGAGRTSQAAAALSTGRAGADGKELLGEDRSSTWPEPPSFANSRASQRCHVTRLSKQPVAKQPVPPRIAMLICQLRLVQGRSRSSRRAAAPTCHLPRQFVIGSMSPLTETAMAASTGSDLIGAVPIDSGSRSCPRQLRRSRRATPGWTPIGASHRLVTLRWTRRDRRFSGTPNSARGRPDRQAWRCIDPDP